MPPSFAVRRRSLAVSLGAISALVTAIAASAQPPAGHYPYFPADSAWTQDVTNAPLDPESATVINWLATHGGWGSGVMRIDFSIEVLEANVSTPFRAFAPKRAEDEFYDPDCDEGLVPLPAGGALEGEGGYACLSDGDCHLIVVHRPTNRLYEMWRADVIGPGPAASDFPGGCMAVWDLRNTYLPNGRGQDCTSADGAGFPIAPLLFNADEVAAGHIDHAIRFILPNSRIRQHVYVHPATHSTFPTSGPPQSPPYGAHLRLRADYPIESLGSAAEKTIAHAMQKYGMFLADGGTLALTAQSDQFTTAKWANLLPGNIQYALDELQVTDFQMVDGGTRYTWGLPNTDCERTYPVFDDGFEVPILPKWSSKTP